MNKKTLGEELAELANPAPELDPERFGDGLELSLSHYDMDYSLDQSLLRNDLPDYPAKKVSRRQMESSDSANESINDENSSEESLANHSELSLNDTDDAEIDNGDSELLLEDSDDAENDRSGSDDAENDRSDSDAELMEYDSDAEFSRNDVGSDSNNSDGESDIRAQLDEMETETLKFTSNLAQAAEAEAEKSTHVKAQIGLWERLLDIRIRIQKPVTIANMMPQSDFENYTNHDTVKEKLVECNSKLSGIMKKLVSIQMDVYQNLPEFTTPKTLNLKKRHFPDDIQEIQERFCKPLDSAFESFRDETIEKWNSKLQVSIPVQKKFKVINQSIVSQINTVLRDQARLISRTQLKRTDYQIIGKEEVSVQADGKVDSHLNNHDPLIFDDGDFYQQLLKELIDSRVKDSKDPLIVDSNLKVLASLQAKRFKKIVDTRASKGRKVRYQVHPKLENFMTSEPRGSWHDEMTQELYSSIFGENGSKEENKEVTVTEGFKLMA